MTQAFKKKTQFSSSGKIILKYHVKYIQTSRIIDAYDQKKKKYEKLIIYKIT